MTTTGTAPGSRGFFYAISGLAAVRLIINAVILVAAYIGLEVLGLWAVQLAAPLDRQWAMLGAALTLSAVMIGIYKLLVRMMERRAATEIRFAPGLAFKGAVFGFILFCALYAALELLGYARWNGFSGYGGVITALAIAIASGVGEETAFRGGIFRVLEDSFGTGLAIAVSAVLFGLLHAANNGATVFSTAAIAWEAGVLLGACYAASGNLWLPIGLHFGWNFTEGGVFGAAVSGHNYQALFKFSLSGPDLMTGGAFGPEASIIALVISGVPSLALIILTIRRGRWKPLDFRMRLN